MKYDRIEVRLNAEHVRKVSELREKYGTSTSDLLRRAIDEEYEKVVQARRKLALDRILAFEPIEDLPDMATLRRQLGRDPDYPQE